MPNPDPALSSLSLGMLPPFMNDEATRAVILDSKPNILTSVYNAIINGSGAWLAGCCVEHADDELYRWDCTQQSTEAGLTLNYGR